MTTEKTKSASSKSRGRRTGAVPAASQGGEVPSDLRHEMISMAAYFRAERRGFCGSESLDDWLAAEAEIDERLHRASPGQN